MTTKSTERVDAEITFKIGKGKPVVLKGSMARAYFTALAEAITIVFRKNKDYSEEDDPLRNFRESEGFGVKTSEAVMVRLSDKWSRIKNFFKNGEYAVKDEAVTDTIVDAINYFAILYAAILEEVEKNGKR